jgi:hypothetical protein
MTCRAALALALTVWTRTAQAADPRPDDAERDAITRALEAPGPRPIEDVGTALDVPPLPPRRRGLSVEASLGALGFASKLHNLSPAASRFRLQVGYDVLRWLMVFASSELAFTSTRYQPPARAFTILALGAGLRATVPLGERLGAYLQADLGTTEVTSNVLHSYGYFGAETFGPYFGAQAGLEWYALDPHYALAVAGGARRLPGFSRSIGSDSGLAWLGSVAIRYTF